MLTQCQKNFARTGYYTLDTTGYYRGKRLNIPEHKMITIRVSTGHSPWIKDNVRCLTGLSLEMAIDTYSVMRRSDRMGEVVFGVWGVDTGEEWAWGVFCEITGFTAD